MRINEKIVYKIPTSIYVIFFAISLILTMIAYGFSAYIDKIEVGDVADWYHTVINICPQILKISEFKGKWIFIVFTVISGILLIIRRFYKEKIYVISHQSMAYDLAEVDGNFKKKYSLRKHALQQVNFIHSDEVDYQVIRDIDKMAIEAQKSQLPIAYYGIAHTPFVFRLGYKIGDQNNVILLHKKRNNSSLFEEWKNEKSGIKIVCSESNVSKKSDELIVAISTSLKIERNHLCMLHPNNKHILFFEANYMDFDSIISYEDAETLRTDILFNIREVVKKYGIKKIHMVISSSVAFTFFLAQGYSAQHDPEIIVYHYEQGNYPWGINMSKNAELSYVKNYI